ncbi:MAG: hypothetical protein Q9200_003880 [Gallowayella weberi]
MVDLSSLTREVRHQSSPGYMPSPGDQSIRVFIAGLHWNNEHILRQHWNHAVLDLVNKLGPNNAHVSIYESGSWDNSKDALRMLDGQFAKLNISRSIILDERTHADEIADGLKPSGDFAAACSLDFLKPPHFYDTFALRDAEGHEAVTSTFPYFRAKASRTAIISGQAVPVKSCWNGIVAFDARPFYHPTSLCFRGIPDSLAQYHLEASECCLIHADNPLPNTHGVWLNPSVKVGYTAEAYRKIHTDVTWSSAVFGIWKHRLLRWAKLTGFKAWRVNSRIRKWRRNFEAENEPGHHCMINEMQVLVANGWAHV